MVFQLAIDTFLPLSPMFSDRYMGTQDICSTWNWHINSLRSDVIKVHPKLLTVPSVALELFSICLVGLARSALEKWFSSWWLLSADQTLLWILCWTKVSLVWFVSGWFNRSVVIAYYVSGTRGCGVKRYVQFFSISLGRRWDWQIHKKLWIQGIDCISARLQIQLKCCMKRKELWWEGQDRLPPSCGM